MGILDTVFKEGVVNNYIVQGTLLQLALEGKSSLFAVLHQEVYRLVDFLHVVGLGSRRVVSKHDTIAAEVVVIGVVAEVAAVGPVLTLRNIEGRLHIDLALAAQCLEGLGLVPGTHLQSLVLPVPHELAGKGWVFLIEVIVLTLVAHGVSHSVGVLTLHMGTDAALAVLVVIQAVTPCGLNETDVAIHRAGDGAPSAVALVVSQAGRIEFADAVHDNLEVISIAAFVARTPDNDRRVVAKRQDMAHIAFHHRMKEGCLMGETHITVTFHIGLCQHV